MARPIIKNKQKETPILSISGNTLTVGDNTVNLPSSGTNTSAYRIESLNYTLVITDRYVEMDTAGTIATLPTAVGILGQDFIIDNSSSSNITVATTGAETINDFSTLTIPTNESATLVSNGTNYRIK